MTAPQAFVPMPKPAALKRPPETPEARAARVEAQTAAILAFLASIGIPVEARALPDDTFLPGMALVDGVLCYDPGRRYEPGDLLHEAGHLAVAAPEDRAAGPVQGDGGEEMAAIAWSYAAARAIGLPTEWLFHADGYLGGAQALIDNFEAGRWIGVPLLYCYDMTYQTAAPDGTPGYPHMVRWVR